MLWRDAVIAALRRYALRHTTRIIHRKDLINEELTQIIRDVDTAGATPGQTLSRVLQELRDKKILYFNDYAGTYLLADTAIHIEEQDFPEDAIDFAIMQNKLKIGILPAADEQVLARRRVGQERLRRATLENYHGECAFCDIQESDLLVAGHIARWADEPESRGDLTNLMCMCCFHDILFERGYFGLTSDFHIVKRPIVSSEIVTLLMDRTHYFKVPQTHPPNTVFLQKHRNRVGLGGLLTA